MSLPPEDALARPDPSVWRRQTQRLERMPSPVARAGEAGIDVGALQHARFADALLTRARRPDAEPGGADALQFLLRHQRPARPKQVARKAQPARADAPRASVVRVHEEVATTPAEAVREAQATATAGAAAQVAAAPVPGGAASPKALSVTTRERETSAAADTRFLSGNAANLEAGAFQPASHHAIEAPAMGNPTPAPTQPTPRIARQAAPQGSPERVRAAALHSVPFIAEQRMALAAVASPTRRADNPVPPLRRSALAEAMAREGTARHTPPPAGLPMAARAHGMAVPASGNGLRVSGHSVQAPARGQAPATSTPAVPLLQRRAAPAPAGSALNPTERQPASLPTISPASAEPAASPDAPTAWVGAASQTVPITVTRTSSPHTPLASASRAGMAVTLTGRPAHPRPENVANANNLSLAQRTLLPAPETAPASGAAGLPVAGRAGSSAPAASRFLALGTDSRHMPEPSPASVRPLNPPPAGTPSAVRPGEQPPTATAPAMTEGATAAAAPDSSPRAWPHPRPAAPAQGISDLPRLQARLAPVVSQTPGARLPLAAVAAGQRRAGERPTQTQTQVARRVETAVAGIPVPPASPLVRGEPSPAQAAPASVAGASFASDTVEMASPTAFPLDAAVPRPAARRALVQRLPAGAAMAAAPVRRLSAGAAADPVSAQRQAVASAPSAATTPGGPLVAFRPAKSAHVIAGQTSGHHGALPASDGGYASAAAGAPAASPVLRWPSLPTVSTGFGLPRPSLPRTTSSLATNTLARASSRKAQGTSRPMSGEVGPRWQPDSLPLARTGYPTGGLAALAPATSNPGAAPSFWPRPATSQAAPAVLQRMPLPMPAGDAGLLAPPQAAAAAHERAAAPGSAPAAAGPDLEALVEKTCARLLESLAVEQERRGVSPWL